MVSPVVLAMMQMSAPGIKEALIKCLRERSAALRDARLLKNTPRPAHAAKRGFTLIEMMIVLVIAGLIFGLVALKALPGPKQTLNQEAQRIALLLQLARDEAIVRNRLVAFEASAKSYRFLVRDYQYWQPIKKDELLRERAFEVQPLTVSITPQTQIKDNTLRIVFGKESVDQSFTLTLASGADSVAIHADGIGHFEVK